MKRVKNVLNKIKAPVLWVIALLFCLLPPLFLASPAGYFPILVFLFLTLISGLYLAALRRSLEWEEGGKAPSADAATGKALAWPCITKVRWYSLQ